MNWSAILFPETSCVFYLHLPTLSGEGDGGRCASVPASGGREGGLKTAVKEDERNMGVWGYCLDVFVGGLVMVVIICKECFPAYR